MKGDTHGLAVQIGRHEGGWGPQFMFDVGQDLEQSGIGFEDLLEVGILVIKRGQVRFVGSCGLLSCLEAIQESEFHDAPPCQGSFCGVGVCAQGM